MDSLGPDPNVNLHLDDVARVLVQDLTPRLVDLLEIAAYVFSADCSTMRGTEWSADDSIEPWDRNFRMVIPVRDYQFWSDPKVSGLLVRTLTFLTSDEWAFDFARMKGDRSARPYLAFRDDNWPFRGVGRVMMFSGGLDSLAGAVETASAGEHLVLVSHRSKGMVNQRQQDLVAELKERYPGKVIHVPVWVTKDQRFGREYNQRSRSFLYVALGAAVATSVQAGGVRFFENGIVSINLPPADEVQRSRASRTTHPRTLHLFSELLSLVAARPFAVDNPFINCTKVEVIQKLATRRAADLIGMSCSCAHGLFQSKSQWHCGTCSQCIDRRIAIVAAGLEQHDPETDYVCDVFCGPRKPGYEQNMGVNFAHHAILLDQMSEDQIATQFNLYFTRAIRDVPEDKKTSAFAQLVKLHKRHGQAVASVIQQQIAKHSGRVVAGEVDDTSLLGMVMGKRHLEPSWRRYCDRIVSLLQAGLPRMCQTERPTNEKRLQELCDGILAGSNMDLAREFPFMRWSASLTKPDWSSDPLQLCVEAKYIRKKEHIHPITEAIAADITKYGDNGQRVLFIVYDPAHLVPDDAQFGAEVSRRNHMLLRFIR
ncbi:MAG: 7-cyano-7-deazaguanine synthase [Planctomycetota bacterium]|nr:7-cyano-7-deazaguanine synthase [Planctomycetota bacterium]